MPKFTVFKYQLTGWLIYYSQTYFFLDTRNYTLSIFTSKKLHMKPVSGLCSTCSSTFHHQTGHGFLLGKNPLKYCLIVDSLHYFSHGGTLEYEKSEVTFHCAWSWWKVWGTSFNIQTIQFYFTDKGSEHKCFQKVKLQILNIPLSYINFET